MGMVREIYVENGEKMSILKVGAGADSKHRVKLMTWDACHPAPFQSMEQQTLKPNVLPLYMRMSLSQITNHINIIIKGGLYESMRC